MSAHSHEWLCYLVAGREFFFQRAGEEAERAPARDIGPGEDDFADAPLLPPLAVAKTESWMLAFLLAHLGQAISCCLLITIFSKCVSQSLQTYS